MCSPNHFFAQTAEITAIEHDLDCFRSTKGVGKEELLKGFMSSQICSWLEEQLQEFGKLSFGKVTSLFHSQILDDPMPYRRVIKEGISNLFAWAALCDTVFEVTRPRHSQIIRAL